MSAVGFRSGENIEFCLFIACLLILLDRELIKSSANYRKTRLKDDVERFLVPTFRGIAVQ